MVEKRWGCVSASSETFGMGSIDVHSHLGQSVSLAMLKVGFAVTFAVFFVVRAKSVSSLLLSDVLLEVAFWVLMLIDHPDPLDRVLAYIDFRRALLDGAIPEVTCVVGTMVQETYGQHPEIRDACAMSIFGHADTLVDDIHAAMRDRGVTGNWSAESLAAHTQAVLQGAFILAKAKGDVDVAVESVAHLRRYVELLFSQPVTAPRRQ